MGKYPASKIHDWWSHWHYNNLDVKRSATMADGDVVCFSCKQQIWHEIRDDLIVAILDLKWKSAIEGETDELTSSECVLMEFYEKHGIPYYIIAIDFHEFETWNSKVDFYVFRPKLYAIGNEAKLVAHLSESEMVGWINEDFDWKTLKAISANKLIEAETSGF